MMPRFGIMNTLDINGASAEYPSRLPLQVRAAQRPTRIDPSNGYYAWMQGRRSPLPHNLTTTLQLTEYRVRCPSRQPRPFNLCPSREGRRKVRTRNWNPRLLFSRSQHRHAPAGTNNPSCSFRDNGQGPACKHLLRCPRPPPTEQLLAESPARQILASPQHAAVVQAEFPPSHRTTHYEPPNKPHSARLWGPPAWRYCCRWHLGIVSADGHFPRPPPPRLSVRMIDKTKGRRPWLHPIRAQLWTIELSLGNNKMQELRYWLKLVSSTSEDGHGGSLRSPPRDEVAPHVHHQLPRYRDRRGLS